MLIDLPTVERNRMLAQRTVLWQSERQACTNAINIMENNVDYRTAINILSNYICCTVILWSQTSSVIEALIDVALKNENGLAIWNDSTPSVKTVETWLVRGRRWKIDECSELFRVFVSIVEVLHKWDKDMTVSMIQGKSSNYQFVSSDPPRFKSTYEIEKKISLKKIEQAMSAVKKTKDNGINIFQKKRESSGSVDPEHPRSRASRNDIVKRITELNNEDVDSKRRFTRLLAYSSGGTNIHSIKPDSMLGVIEWIYGLPGGADTSGTTAEIISLCNLFSSYLPKDEIDFMTQGVPWYLGPVFAMVKNGHHTFLECAIAIYYGAKLYDDCNIPYIPGQYNTIKDAFQDPTTHDIAKDIIEKLEEESQDIYYLFKPDTGAWTDSKENQISLLGGTIMNNYSYWKVSSKYRSEFNKFTIEKVLEQAGIAFADSHDALVDQMDTLYSGIKKQITSD